MSNEFLVSSRLRSAPPQVRKEEIAGGQYELRYTTDDETVINMVASALNQLEHKRATLSIETFQRLIDTLPMTAPEASDAIVSQALANRDKRQQFVDEFTLVNAEQIYQLAASSARNHGAIASRWAKEGKIFWLQFGGQHWYPAFQFGDDGQPLPVIKRLVAAGKGYAEHWALALWLASPTGWLDGRRPVDCLSQNPDGVVDALEQTVAPVG